MKYTILINQVKALEFGLNVNQCLILDLINHAQTWAEPNVINGDVFYWTSRHHIVNELPILALKPDTAYRHFRSLDALGLIEYRKIGQKDVCRLTRLGKQYTTSSAGDNLPNPEMDPSKLGNESGTGSEADPIYKTTKQQTTKNLGVFWSEYPKHNGKHECEIWFAKNRPCEKTMAEIMDGLARAKVSEGWRKGFVPDPINFLKKKRWEDKHDLPSPGAKGSAKSKHYATKVEQEIERRRQEAKLIADNATSPETARKILQEIKQKTGNQT